MTEEQETKQASTPAAKSQTTLGKLLKEAREKTGLDLKTVSAKLCIRQLYLTAIEADKFSELPGRAYVIGFLRSYAVFLGLPAEELVSRFKLENHEKSEATASLRMVAEADHEVIFPKKHTLIGVVFLLFLFYLFWQAVSFYSQRGESGKGKSFLSVSSTEGEADSLPGTISLSENGGAELASPSLLKDTKTFEKEAETVSESFLVNALSEVNLQKVMGNEGAASSSPSPGTASTLAPLNAAKPQEYGQQTADTKIVVEALGDTWIKVSKEDTVLISKFFHKGDRYYVPAAMEGPGLRLDAGNAGMTRLIVQGKVSEPLGAPGTAKKGIVLDLMSGKSAQPAPTAQPAKP